MSDTFLFNCKFLSCREKKHVPTTYLCTNSVIVNGFKQIDGFVQLLFLYYMCSLTEKWILNVEKNNKIKMSFQYIRIYCIEFFF